MTVGVNKEEFAQAEEERRKREKPNITMQHAAKVVEYLWNIKVVQNKMKPLVSYDDQNFYCLSTEGVEYTLKIHNGVESDQYEFIELQNEMLTHISKTFPCPKPVPCFSNQMLAYAYLPLKDSANGRWFVLRLLTWVPGNVLSNTDHGRATTVKMGEVLFQLQQSTLGFNHPTKKHAIRTHQ